MPEGRRVFARMTVEENLRAGGLGAAIARGARDGQREQVYELFPVLRRARAAAGGLLSGGEQQMLAIGRALMAGPRLLLLDEPSLGLAPQMVGRIAGSIREIHAQGTAVVLVEQNADDGAGGRRQRVRARGRPGRARRGRPPSWPRSEDVQRLYLGGHAESTGAGAMPSRGKRRTDTRGPVRMSCRDGAGSPREAPS